MAQVDEEHGVGDEQSGGGGCETERRVYPAQVARRETSAAKQLSPLQLLLVSQTGEVDAQHLRARGRWAWVSVTAWGWPAPPRSGSYLVVMRLARVCEPARRGAEAAEVSPAGGGAAVQGWGEWQLCVLVARARVVQLHRRGQGGRLRPRRCRHAPHSAAALQRLRVGRRGTAGRLPTSRGRRHAPPHASRASQPHAVAFGGSAGRSRHSLNGRPGHVTAHGSTAHPRHRQHTG